MLIIIIFVNPIYAKRYALIIGISDYEKVRDLYLSDSDAITFKNHLISYCKVDEKNITILLNSQAQKSSIFKYLNKYSEDLNKNDEFIFYFSGHGAQDTIIDTSINEPDKKNEYLVPWEGENRNLSTLIKDDEIFKDIDIPNTILLAASRPEEVAWEYPGRFDNSVFTHFLCKGLKGGAEYNNQYGIEINELKKYLEKEVVKATGYKQHVHIIDNTKQNPILGYPNFRIKIEIKPDISNTSIYLNKEPISLLNENVEKHGNRYIVSDLPNGEYTIGIFNPNLDKYIKKTIYKSLKIFI